MRQGLILSVVAVAAALATSSAGAATTSTLNAEFQVFFGKSTAHPCSAFVCGVGSVSGYGRATADFFITSFTGFDENGCGETTAVETIALASGGGSLTLDESGTVCAPSGASSFTPGSLHSFGNPYRLTLAYTVSDGAGVFAGASGSGTVTMRLAGESGSKTVTGSLTLP